MNIKYHILVGGIGYVITHEPSFLIASIIPDVTLLYNEIVNRPFNAGKVDKYTIFIYSLVHALPFTILMLYFGWPFFIGYIIHILSDSFTHTGKFAWKPMYPFSNYQVTYGKEILK